jgi:hypothetical protein
MTNLDALTDGERENYASYLEQARRAGESPGMAERRDSNNGRHVDPSEMLLKQAPANAHADYVDAIFAKQK